MTPSHSSDVLGLRFLFAAPPQMSFWQTGNVRLLVAVPEDGQKANRGSMIYFRVADIQAVHKTLATRGVKFFADRISCIVRRRASSGSPGSAIRMAISSRS